MYELHGMTYAIILEVFLLNHRMALEPELYPTPVLPNEAVALVKKFTNPSRLKVVCQSCSTRGEETDIINTKIVFTLDTLQVL
jgi:hypothetical protein